jgi:Concanavalin A-like lectin/glucanases superfamily
MVLRILRTALAAAAILFALPAAANAASFSFPLVGWWPMNEGSGQVIRDWSGQRNNGYLGTTPNVDSSDPTWVDGVFNGSALRFFGDDIVTIPAGSSLRPQRLTVAAWIRYDKANFGDDQPGIYKTAVTMGDDSCQGGSYGLITSTNLGIQFYITVNNTALLSPAALPTTWDGKWHHVAGTFDGDRVRLYVDGKQIGNGSPTSTGTRIQYDLPTTDDGAIGGLPGECDAAGLNFRGDVDGVQIWNQAIPVDTVWALLKSLFTSAR